MLGYALVLTGDLAIGEIALQQALSLGGDSASTYYHLGVLYQQQKRNPEAVSKGLAWLCAAAQQAPGGPQALFAVRAKAHLGKVLADVVPAPWIEDFKSSKCLKIHGISVHLLTLQSGATYWAGPVLIVDPTSRLLNRVDDVEGVRAVGVVSWNWPEVQAWIQRWRSAWPGKAPTSLSIIIPIAKRPWKSPGKFQAWAGRRSWRREIFRA